MGKQFVPIKHSKVSSSHLTTLGYDKERQFLEVAFWNKSLYGFDDVTPKEAREIKQAISKGKYFWKVIREIKPTIKIKQGDSTAKRPKRK